MRFFSAIKTCKEDKPPQQISDAVEVYGVPPSLKGGSYYEVEKIIESIPNRFTIPQLREECRNIPEYIIRRALLDVKREGKIRYNKKVWEKINHAF